MSSELKAGFFVLAALTALVYMTTKLTQNRFSFAGTKRYYADIVDATGLLSKSKIKMAGLDVGQLEDVTLIGSKVRLTLQIGSNIKLHRDASVAVKTIGFLGDKYLELFPGSDTSPIMEEGGVLTESVAGGGLDQLTAKTTQVLENLREITDLLKQGLKGAEGVEGDTRLDHILDNLEHFTESLGAIDKVSDLADHLNEIAANIRAITDKVQRGEGTLGKLVNESDTVDQLNHTLSGVNKFITKSEKLRVEVDAHTGLLSHTGGAKSSVSLILRPTYDKYYLLGVSSSPRGVQSVSRTSSKVNPDDPGSVTTTTEEKKVVETAVSFNAQFAKRFGDATFRLGLFENTGGVGIDYDFIERLRVTSEVYRFVKGDKPQVNLGAEFHIYKPFYIWAGGDDILSTTFRNFFGGGGIRFTDQDIKNIVTAAAIGR